jgi:DNA gyrase/topoisomerase IV subunit A
MPSLPTLADEHRDLMQEIEELIQSGGDEETLQSKLEEKLSLEDASRDKLAGYYRILKTLKHHIDAIEEEEDALSTSKSRAENALESLERNVKYYMKEIEGTDELYAGPAHFKVNQVGGRRSLNLTGDESEYPIETKKVTIKVTIDGREIESESELDAIREDIQRIASTDGVDYDERSRVIKSRVRDVMSDSSALVEYEERGDYLSY